MPIPAPRPTGSIAAPRTPPLGFATRAFTLLALGAALIATLLPLTATPASAGTAGMDDQQRGTTFKCGKSSQGWQTKEYSRNSKDQSWLPSKVGYSVHFNYCANIFTRPQQSQVFPGGIKIDQDVYAGTWLPLTKVQVSDEKEYPTVVTKDRCSPPGQPSVSTPCLVVTTKMAATVRSTTCAFVGHGCLPVNKSRWEFTSKVAVTMGSSWLIKATGRKI